MLTDDLIAMFAAAQAVIDRLVALTGRRPRPAIAEHLFVAQATVETHLRHAFRKLNITSRAELPASLDT